MGKYWLGASLLAVLLLFGIWVFIDTDQTLLPIADALEQASEQVLSGEMSSGVALAQGAMQRWNARWHATAVFADHAPMDEIDGLFAQLDSYRTWPEQYAACCARIAQLIYAMAEAHSPAWWNVL